jgi:hypothetical protein
LGDNIDGVAVMLLPVTFRCVRFWTSTVFPFLIIVYITTCVQTSVLGIIRLDPELLNQTGSVTWATVSTITFRVGETSYVRQTVEPPNIEFNVLKDCPYIIELERPSYLESVATRQVKKARYMGTISACLLQEGTLYGVN